MKYLTDLAMYNHQFAVARFLVDTKTDSNRKECMNPISLESWSLDIVFLISRRLIRTDVL